MEEDDSLIIECSDGVVPTTCSLASRLEFFKVMLRLEVKEAKEKVCQLKDYNKKQLGTLFDVLAGKIEAKEMSVEKLLYLVPLAHYLNAKEVLNAAADKINNLVRNSNFGDVIENFNVYVDLAVQFNSEQLKDVCRKYWISERQERRCATFTTSQKICASCNYCHFCGRKAYTFGPKSACYANCSEASGLKLIKSFGYLSGSPNNLSLELAKYDISLVGELFPSVEFGLGDYAQFFGPLFCSGDVDKISDQQLQDILSLDLETAMQFLRGNSSASSHAILSLAERPVIKDAICAKMLGLCLSSGFFYLRAAQRMIEKCGAYTDKAFNTDCLNPLHLACKWDQEHLVEYILGKGANVNCLTSDNKKLTPLHIAASSNSCKAVETLLQFKADLKIGDSSENYPIHVAANCEKIDIVKLLIKAGTKLDLQNKHGHTALHVAVKYGKIDIVKVLVEAGADRTISDYDSKSACDIAMTANRRDIVDVLLQKPCNLQ